MNWNSDEFLSHPIDEIRRLQIYTRHKTFGYGYSLGTSTKIVADRIVKIRKKTRFHKQTFLPAFASMIRTESKHKI